MNASLRPFPRTKTGRDRSGFSLLELSVVIVIIALLIGGVVAGQSLLQASQMRSIYIDANRYIEALNNFYKKYDYLPGDFPNATGIWGTAPNCPDGGSSNQTTCNGNGDGIINLFSDNGSLHEAFSAWQHLSNAGMIEGAYLGAGSGAQAGGAATNAVPKVNVPGGAITSSGYSIVYADSAYTSWYPVFPGYFDKHFMVFGGGSYNKPTGGPSDLGILSAEQAKAIDLKVDDGLPGTGNLSTYLQSAGIYSCSTSNDPTNAVYNTISPFTTTCNLVFLTGF